MPKIHRNQADKSIINDKHFEYDNSREYEQGISSDVWIIHHNLNKKPAITIVDDNDRVIEGQKEYIDDNTVKITLNAVIKGKVYLN